MPRAAPVTTATTPSLSVGALGIVVSLVSRWVAPPARGAFLEQLGDQCGRPGGAAGLDQMVVDRAAISSAMAVAITSGVAIVAG
jgi:hypothetical protein